MTRRRRRCLVRAAALVTILLVWFGRAPAQADPVGPVAPSSAGMPGNGLWQKVLGWMMQWGLWLSLAAIVLGAGGWWISASTGSYGGASRGKQLVLGGAIGALLIGLGPTMVDLLFNAGRGG